MDIAQTVKVEFKVGDLVKRRSIRQEIGVVVRTPLGRGGKDYIAPNPWIECQVRWLSGKINTVEQSYLKLMARTK
tara:strand:- start:524 stop:748 length:225 start_codon:yes stop_codon:yes gene_type:complete